MADQIEGLPEGATIGPSLQTQVEGLPEGATVGPSLTQTTPAATAQPAEKPSKIYDLWETANKPLLEQPKIEKRATEYAQAPPTLAESEHPYLTAAKKFGAGVVGSTEKMARDFSSPLGIATMAAGPIVEAAGEAAPATKALVTEAAPYLSSLAKYGKGALGTLFGTQGAIEAGKGIQQISKEGLTPEAAEQTLSGAGQAAMGATMGLHGTEMGEAPAQKTLMAPVRGAAKLATPMSHIIPSVGGMIGAAELGIPHPWIVGGSLGRFVLPPEYLQRLFERGRTAGLSAEEANIVHLQDRYNEALKDAEQPRKAYEAHEAGRQQGIPAPQDVLDAHQKAQTALQTAEAHLHAAEQDYVNKAKTASATTGPMELSPEQQAAQAERMAPPPTNEKLGARQEKLMADIEAKAPPYAEGTEPFPRMGEKQPGMTAGEPEVPAAKAEAPPVMTAGKPERAPSMAGLKVTPEGKVIDTTAGPEAATREALGAEKPARMVPATEGVAVRPGEVPPMKGEYTELTGKRLGVPPPVTEDIGAKVRGEAPPLPRGERREAVRTPEQEQTTRLFKQARTELGENASSDDVMARVDALKKAEAKGIPADNKDVAKTLRETADNLEVAKKDAFLVRAYRNAAQAVEELPRNVSDMAKEPEKLLEVPGIDKGMLHHIQEVLASEKTEGVKAFPEEKAQQLSRVVSELPNQDLQRLGTRFGLDESKYDFTKREALREGGSKHPIEREKFSKDAQEKLPESLKNHIVDAAKAFDEKDPSIFSPQDLSSTGNAARSRAIIAEAMKRYTDELAAKGQAVGLDETVGTKEGADRDTELFSQAQKELPEGTLSEQLVRAQELKENPDTATDKTEGPKATEAPKKSNFSPVDKEEYFKAVQGNSQAASLTSPEEMANNRTFSNGRGVYYSIDPKGDIQALVNNSPSVGALPSAMRDAIANGGKTLDAWDLYLPKFYEKMGFENTDHVPYDEETYGPPSDALKEVWKKQGWKENQPYPGVQHMKVTDAAFEKYGPKEDTSTTEPRITKPEHASGEWTEYPNLTGDQIRMSAEERSKVQEELAKKGVSGGAPSKKMPTGDDLIKKYGESDGDPAHTTFILADGRGVANTGVDHDVMLGGKATDAEPRREQFIAEGNIRVRPRPGGIGGREVALSIPLDGINKDQMDYLQKMGPQLRSGTVMIEGGKPGSPYRILEPGKTTSEALENAVNEITEPAKMNVARMKK